MPLRKALLLWIVAATVWAAPPRDGATAFKENCAACHEGGGSNRAPAFIALKLMGPQRILRSMESGGMKVQAAALGPEERRAVAEFIAGRSLGQTPEPISPSTAQCAGAPRGLASPATALQWNGWGADLGNRRFQSADRAGLSAETAPRLKLKWAFGFPDAILTFAQPAVFGGRVFVGSQSGMVYALDARTGCIDWTFQASPAGVRTAISVAPLPGSNPPRYAAYFGDLEAYVYGLDAAGGQVIWKQRVDENPVARVTGAPLLHDGRLYVPVSSIEEVVGSDPKYECCRFRGNLVALDAGNGRVLWKSFTVPSPPKPTRKNPLGTQLWGPSGASIWSSPTLDLQRKAVYVTTGDNYSEPTTETSDAILAFDMDSGKRLWSRQMTTGDSYTLACERPDKVNCPESKGPDFDFGSSPILVSLPGGRRALIAGQKSGVAHAVDPDRQGDVLWQVRVGRGSTLGGIQWGPAADDEKVYVAVADATYQKGDINTALAGGALALDPKAGGGLFALRTNTGEKVWHMPAPASGCAGKAQCSPSQSAAVTVIPGVVFSGSVDGHLRAYAAESGRILWDFDTAQEYPTVNGVKGRGGSIDGPGPVVAGGMLFVNSGYAIFGGMPGNVLLAFSVDGK